MTEEKGRTSGLEWYQLDKEQYKILRDIVAMHSNYLLEMIGRSLVVLEARKEISETMKEEREIIYYAGALEQTKIYLDIIANSVNDMDVWYEYNNKTNPKKKRIKRIPVKSKQSRIYRKIKGKDK